MGSLAIGGGCRDVAGNTGALDRNMFAMGDCSMFLSEGNRSAGR